MCTHLGDSSPEGAPALGPGRSGPRARSPGSTLPDPAPPAAAHPPAIGARASALVFVLCSYAWHPPVKGPLRLAPTAAVTARLGFLATTAGPTGHRALLRIERAWSERPS